MKIYSSKIFCLHSVSVIWMHNWVLNFLGVCKLVFFLVWFGFHLVFSTTTSICFLFQSTNFLNLLSAVLNILFSYFILLIVKITKLNPSELKKTYLVHIRIFCHINKTEQFFSLTMLCNYKGTWFHFYFFIFLKFKFFLCRNSLKINYPELYGLLYILH